MIRRLLLTTAALALLTGPALALDVARQGPPTAPWKKVSSLVQLPDFVPGLGTLYVRPETLPAGPFLAYDRQNTLVGTVYMIPMKEMENQKDFSGLDAASLPVDHVDITFNGGHPGVEEPHYHVTLWHVPEAAVAALSK